MQFANTDIRDKTSLPKMSQRLFLLFRDLVHKHTGIFLPEDKTMMLSSRLSRSVQALGVEDFDAYYQMLRNSPRDSPEIRDFINSVTTNRTSFFRDPLHFEFLANTVVPELKSAARRGSPSRIRIWSAAASTGEELYSIAMILLESLPSAHWNIDLVGSDIDTEVLDTARRAIYPAEGVAHVETSLVNRYFLRGERARKGQVKLKSEVTSLTEFRRVNLMDADWPIDGIFDAIFFRNVLIYFHPDTQEIFLRRLLRHLAPGGYLFLGSAEYVPWLGDVLEQIHRSIYRLRPAGR